jgi:hypothetical protein
VRSASVSRIVVFFDFDKCRTTNSTAFQMPNCVWRTYGGGGIWRGIGLWCIRGQRQALIFSIEVTWYSLALSPS